MGHFSFGAFLLDFGVCSERQSQSIAVDLASDFSHQIYNCLVFAIPQNGKDDSNAPYIQ